MKLIDRYIGQVVLFACIGVALTITALDGLFAFIDESNDISAQYTTLEVVIYTLLTLPRKLVEHMPMAVMVGSLVGLGMLANHSELTVIRAAGVSTQRILLAVVKPVLVLMFAALLVGEYVAPYSEQLAESRRAELTTDGRIYQDGGIWHKDGEWFLHMRAIRPSGDLVGLTLYKFSEPRTLELTGRAAGAEYRDGQWYLQDARFTRFETDQVSVERAQRIAWDVGLDPALLSVLMVEPERMSMQGLYRYSTYTEQQGVSSDPYMLAFWQKVLMPLAVIALVLIAMSAIFGPLRSVTMGQRIMVGLLVGIIFKLVQDLLGPASAVYGFSPLLAASFPILLCALIGGWMLRRAG